MKYDTLQLLQIKTKNFDIKHTIESGQPLTFFAEYDDAKKNLVYSNANNVIKLNFSGNSINGKITVFDTNQEYAKREIVNRFRLRDDMNFIYSKISTDSFMANSIKNYHGMRLTLNDPWETILCYIISQYNNMKRIRKITKNIIERFGVDIKEDNKTVAKTFPSSEELLKASEKLLLECGAGFRAKYIKEAAEFCSFNIDLYKLKSKDYYTLKEDLMQISGVGDKVADCIALLGYGKLEAFPIDVWVKRTLENVYFKGKEKKIKDLHKFADKKWGNLSGYAQQYLYWNGMHI